MGKVWVGEGESTDEGLLGEWEKVGESIEESCCKLKAKEWLVHRPSILLMNLFERELLLLEVNQTDLKP